MRFQTIGGETTSLVKGANLYPVLVAALLADPFAPLPEFLVWRLLFGVFGLGSDHWRSVGWSSLGQPTWSSLETARPSFTNPKTTWRCSRRKLNELADSGGKVGRSWTHEGHLPGFRVPGWRLAIGQIRGDVEPLN